MIRRPATAPPSRPEAALDRLLGGGTALGLGDGELLDRVAAGAGPAAEAAFEALVGRHGPMVARVCRGILGDVQLAEDAAQAAFLVLHRRAGAVGDPGRLAPWLHGVALRTARAARRQHRRHALDPIPPDDPTMTSTAPDPTQAALARERAEILHAAIARLPHRYRAPVVLCDLEGLTHAEAARRLGCPTATVSVRLKRARERLRAALARHRLDFESALPPIALGAAPRALVATAAARLLARQVLGVAALAQCKAIAAAALVAGLAAVGTVAAPPAGQDPPASADHGTHAPTPAVAIHALPAAPAPRPVLARRGAVSIVKLTYSDWPNAPLSIRHLYRSLRRTLKPGIEIFYDETRASEAALRHCSLAYLHGHEALEVGADELSALRRYLGPGGGTLFADAADGSSTFDASFRRLVAELLPDGKLEPIPPGDAVYTRKMVHDLADARRTPAAGGAVGFPDLEGVKVDGRWAVIYSKLDIGDALQDQNGVEYLGYTPESATRIATNVVVYATLPNDPALPAEIKGDPPTAPNVAVVPQDPPAPRTNPAPKADPKPAPVEVAPGVMVGLPTVRDVTDFEQYNGRVAASRTVEVRARHDGVILDAKVVEGDLVRAGQALFELEQSGRPTRTAEIDALRTQSADAKRRMDRVRAAAADFGDPASMKLQKEIDGLDRQLAALVARGRPAVVAPFGGQVARQLVDVGATVEAGRTPLATIVAVDPILVDFEMDERTFLKIRRWLRTKPETTYLPVRVQLTGEGDFPHEGRVLVQAGRFNPETGTCTLHAELPNPDHALIPGLSARVRLDTGDPHRAFLVPETAIGTEQGMKSLRLVDPAGVVQHRPIRVGMLVDDLRAVEEGIAATTWVILDPRTGPGVGAQVAAPPR